MSSIKDRQRAAARARLEKEMAERAAAAKKRRQTQAIIGSAVAVLVIAGTAVWIVSALNSKSKTTPVASTSAAPSASAAGPAPAVSATAPAAAGTANCAWYPQTAATGGKIKDVGLPPTNVPAKGADTFTMNTNLGVIAAKLDLTKVPCTAAAFEYLGSKKFWDNSKCHRLVNQASFKVLQCGDPYASGKGYRDTDGMGGPSFAYGTENLPTGAAKPYPKGVIAMANTGQPNSTGSQFFIVFADTKLSADYTVLGTITTGMNIVDAVGKAGDDGAFAQQAGGGHPKTEVDIKTLTVTKG
ncbi:MAG: peptidyl-prolyl cis-trans isomerase [Actinoplanes sp.]|nr:peptidyl-prolyl cis-trans isomerase [Actinoplanes sp.]